MKRLLFRYHSTLLGARLISLIIMVMLIISVLSVTFPLTVSAAFTITDIDIPFSFVDVVADVDGDGQVTLMDATLIQRWLADLKSNENIGKPIV